MVFKRVESFLAGESFDEGLVLELEPNPLFSRVETIIRIVKNQNVIHVGCCDHIPLIENKISEGTWLHGILDRECKSVLGIDINEDAVNYVNNHKHSINPIICCDATKDDIKDIVDISDYEWIVLGEILEHVDNPVMFLHDFQSNMRDNGFTGRIIITVPNAFSFQKEEFIGREIINTDHRYWFTPYTLAKVVYRAGLYPQELLFTDYKSGNNGKNTLTRKMTRLICKVFKKPLKWHSFRSAQLLLICSYRNDNE